MHYQHDENSNNNNTTDIIIIILLAAVRIWTFLEWNDIAMEKHINRYNTNAMSIAHTVRLSFAACVQSAYTSLQ